MEKIKVYSAYDEKEIREFEINDFNYIEGLLKQAREVADNPDEQMTVMKRKEILEKAANIIEERQEDLAKQLVQEGGKPIIDSRIEIKRAITGIRIAIIEMEHMVGREIPMNIDTSSINRKAYTIREPIGVVVAISAFNHPFNLIIHQIIPALAVGCPVIVKPAKATPISCYNILNILYEAGLPKKWCQMIVCKAQDATKLVSDERVDFLTFIGSPGVGWMLRSKLAPGTRCALEHGGVAPVIVDKGADIKKALPLLAKGGLYHAGQVCVSVQRVYVEESISGDLIEGLVELAKQNVVGDPLSEKTTIGPLISRKEVDRVHQWVMEAKEQGAEILIGGKKQGETCYEATILLNPSEESIVSQKEIFGPVICIYTYKDRLEAIQRANKLPFSFQAAVFAQDVDIIFDTIKRIKAKTVMVNDHTAFRVDWMPFGGRKSSGLGVGGIIPAMEEMTEEKMFVIKSDFL